MKRTHCIAIAALALGVLAAVPSTQAQTKKISFAVYELSPSVSSDSSYVRDINEFGQVVGYVSDGTNRSACIWDPNDDGEWTIKDLGASEYYDKPIGSALNESGQVAGYTLLGSPSEAFFYDDLTSDFVTLPKLEGFTPYASGMNNYGVVCGYSLSGDFDLATLWECGDNGVWTVTNLSELLNTARDRSCAVDVNDDQQIVGYSRDNSTVSDDCAHVWQRNVERAWTITNLPGNLSRASAISNTGRIAGTHVISGSRHACFWEQIGVDWHLIDLSPLASEYSSCDARDINDLGQVVGLGNKVSGGTAAYLYENGVMQNLNNFLPAAASGWYLSGAWAINDSGQIVGFGYNPVGAYRGFLMDTRAVTYSYTSTGSAVSIKDKSTVSKAMTLTDNATITDLNVKVTLYHTRYADLQFDLVGPDNVTARNLCAAGAVTGSGTKTLVFDDDGAVGTIKANSLSYYDNGSTSTAGKWTLKITDTVKNLKTGSFTSFTLDVVPVIPAM